MSGGFVKYIATRLWNFLTVTAVMARTAWVQKVVSLGLVERNLFLVFDKSFFVFLVRKW